MAETVRVRIYDSRIQSMFAPGGDVWGFARRIGRETKDLGFHMAPKRSFDLARSIEFAVTPVPMGCITTVRATAPHALYVILGTGGPGRRIYPRRAKALWLTPGNGYPSLTRRSVSGQTANNFLDEAKSITLRLNGVS